MKKMCDSEKLRNVFPISFDLCMLLRAFDSPAVDRMTTRTHQRIKREITRRNGTLRVSFFSMWMNVNDKIVPFVCYWKPTVCWAVSNSNQTFPWFLRCTQIQCIPTLRPSTDRMVDLDALKPNIHKSIHTPNSNMRSSRQINWVILVIATPSPPAVFHLWRLSEYRCIAGIA